VNVDPFSKWYWEGISGKGGPSYIVKISAQFDVFKDYYFFTGGGDKISKISGEDGKECTKACRATVSCLGYTAASKL